MQHSRMLRARAAPRWVWSAYTYQWHCSGESPLSFGAHPWCDMPAAASYAKPAMRVMVLAVPGNGAQRSSLLRARAVPGWLWSARTLWKGAGPTRGLSPSARARGVTCQLRTPTSSQRHVSRSGAGAPALAVIREEAQHSSLLCSRRAEHSSAGYGRLMTRQREASLLRCAPVLRRARRGFQHQALSQRRVSRGGTGAPARRRSLSLGRRGSTQAC